jgi:hypothetical protein
MVISLLYYKVLIQNFFSHTTNAQMCMECRVEIMNLIYKVECLFVVEIQTAGPISAKFCVGVFFDGGTGLGRVWAPYPKPRGQGYIS